MERLGILRIAASVSISFMRPVYSQLIVCSAATAMLIINRIVHAQITPIPLTMPEYPYSPAPSPKGLWNAGNETDWSVDYAEYLHRNAMHGMLKNGDLVRLKEAAGEQHDRWYAHADSFGLLVTLASSVTS
jgi:hypothetical protein